MADAGDLKSPPVIPGAGSSPASPIHDRVVIIGEILGEYFTGPEHCRPVTNTRGPSRTAVDFDGSLWVANRNNITQNTIQACGQAGACGHITKIGNGLALQWVDRNCNGVLDTHLGVGSPLSWGNADTACNAHDVNYAEDELILLYQPVTTTGTRTVAVAEKIQRIICLLTPGDVEWSIGRTSDGPGGNGDHFLQGGMS